LAEQMSVPFGLFKVELGNGAGSEVFTAPCALRSKGIQFQGQQSEVYLLDCADPDAASWATRNITGQSATMSGAGTVDPEDLDVWRVWFESAAKKNIRVGPRLTLAQGGGYWQGPFIITNFSITSNKDDNGGLATFEVEMQSAGKVVWVPASA
jgi:predicted secreted protein